MLYRFKSRATGDVLMLQPNAEQLLEIIGKYNPIEPARQGILLPEDMTPALTALQEAVAAEDAARAEALAKAKAEHTPTSDINAISLHQCALPLMDMMRECLKAKAAITWEV